MTKVFKAGIAITLSTLWIIRKVFDYFASFRSPSGEVLMTLADLMRAVVLVFPTSESNRVREGFLRGDRTPAREEFRKIMATTHDQYTQEARCKDRQRADVRTAESVEN